MEFIEKIIRESPVVRFRIHGLRHWLRVERNALFLCDFYGEDTLVLQEGLLGHANRVLIADDLVATGGSMLATKRLVEQAEARVIGFTSIINLAYLNTDDMKSQLHITQEEITK